MCVFFLPLIDQSINADFFEGNFYNSTQYLPFEFAISDVAMRANWRIRFYLIWRIRVYPNQIDQSRIRARD